MVKKLSVVCMMRLFCAIVGTVFLRKLSVNNGPCSISPPAKYFEMLSRRAKFLRPPPWRTPNQPLCVVSYNFHYEYDICKTNVQTFRVWLVDQTISSIRSNNLFFSRNMDLSVYQGLVSQIVVLFQTAKSNFPFTVDKPCHHPKRIIAPPNRQLLSYRQYLLFLSSKRLSQTPNITFSLILL